MLAVADVRSKLCTVFLMGRCGRPCLGPVLHESRLLVHQPPSLLPQRAVSWTQLPLLRSWGYAAGEQAGTAIFYSPCEASNCCCIRLLAVPDLCSGGASDVPYGGGGGDNA